MRVFILTGEPSGDLHGAHLASALRDACPDIHLEGVGGSRMREAGVQLAAVSEHWGAIGIAEALGKLPALLCHFRRLVRVLLAGPPDVLVLIDFGAFNMRVLRAVQGSGIRTVYYIPPGSWSRRRTAGQLPFLADAIATPFPWSAEMLQAAGGTARVEWVGHPLLDYCAPTLTRAEARQRLGLDDSRPVLVVAPGSRRRELRYLLPQFIGAIRCLSPVPHCLVPVAPSLGEAAMRRLFPHDLDVTFLHGMDYDLLQAADAAIASTGTATLELACLHLPMVTAYRGSLFDSLQYLIVARSGALRYIALPNIIADAPLVPEFRQYDANPRMLAAALQPLLHDTPARRAQLDGFAGIQAALGDGTACRRVATLVLKTAACPPDATAATEKS